MEGPQDTKVICGEDVVLFCRASGNPEPQVTFLWNSQELNPSLSDTGPGVTSPGMVVRALPKGNGLTIRAKLQMSNNGDTVTCRVYNQFGTDSAKAKITVYDANERMYFQSFFCQSFILFALGVGMGWGGGQGKPM